MTWSVGQTRGAALGTAVACLAAFFVAQAEPASAASKRAQIDATIRQAIKAGGINAVIVDVTVGGKRIIRKAYGQSLPGVPATTDMHFRNGNVVAPFMSALLLRLVDQGKVKLDDRISKWLPGLREADRVTLRMLAGMSAGYHDYVRDERLAPFIYGNPFGRVTTKNQLELSLSRPHQFTPGSNWSYSHTNYVILGLTLEKITRMSLRTALSRYVLKPLGLKNTRASQTAKIPEPVLHTFSSERRGYLGIPEGQRFIEETTFWNPSWTFASGSVETTDITDMTRSIVGIGTGKLLKRKSYLTQIDPQIGFGHPVPQPECDSCRGPLTRELGYGLGVFRNGSWIAAQPLFAGLGSVAAYRPKGRVSIAVAVALNEGGFTADGSTRNLSRPLYRQIGLIVAPKDPPPPGS
jgi:CubicO group peptidase (beta-lactamase class C family)